MLVVESVWCDECDGGNGDVRQFKNDSKNSVFTPKEQFLVNTTKDSRIENSLILFVFWYIFIYNKTRHGTPSGTAPGRVVLFMGART
jgi:hypothetical protein